MQRVLSWATVLVMLAACYSFLLDPASAERSSKKRQTGAASDIQLIQTDKTSGITEYRLKSNGLQILLAERHATPIVTVMVVYHVGSRNEAVGYTGATHFLEHMMFRGTRRHDPLKGTGLDDVLKPVGGINNATTFYDRTNYYEIVPAQNLALCLDLEADRMRSALLREQDRTAEMTVVRNELERNEDDPCRLLDVNLFAAAFREHPYHHPVIGWRSDVEGVPIERLRQFYHDFYYPDNATLVVIGDFKTAEALKLTASYFGKIPRAPRPFPRVYTVEPPQEGERRFVVQRGEDLPKVALAYHTPKSTDSDAYPLEVIASLLGDDKRQSSRLYKALVDPGLCSDCYAFNYSLRDPSLFTIVATATPGTPSPKVEKTLIEQLQQLVSEPVSNQELERAKRAVWKRLKLDAADPAGMASQLAEAIAVADWQWWAAFEKRIQSVSQDDIKRVAAKYFRASNRTVGYYYPAKADIAEQTAPASALPDPKCTGKEQGSDRSSSMPASAASNTQASASSTPEGKGGAKAGPGPALPSGRLAPNNRSSIASQVRKKILPNGLTALVMPVPGCGVVCVSGKIRAGNYFRSPQLTVVPALTADMLSKGSKSYSKDALAQQLENLGTSLEFTAENFWVDFQSDIVTEDLETFLPLLADVLESPLFLPDELEKLKKQKDAQIQADMANTAQVATHALYGRLYKPQCVYFEPTFKHQLDELPQIASDTLKNFHKDHFSPSNTILAVVGDIDSDRAFDLIARYFASWDGATAQKIQIDEGCIAEPVTARRINSLLADKTNVDIMIAHPCQLSINSRDFYAASVANAALGHDTVGSRLAEVRNKYGFTYGIASFFLENCYPWGPWVIALSVNPENVAKTLPLVTRIVENYYGGGITPKELKDEVRHLAGEYVVERMRTPRQLADALTKYEFLGLGPQFMDNYPKNLQAVTQAQVNAAIHKYFNVKNMVTSVAGTLDTKGK